MTWPEKLTQLSRMVGEPEAASLNAPVSGARDTPYAYQDLLENALLVEGQQALREIPETRLNLLRLPSYVSVTAVGDDSGLGYGEYELPIEAVRIVSVLIDGVVAAESSIEGLLQRRGSTRTNCFAFAEGKILFLGLNATIEYINECTLAEWQANDILPEEFDEEHISRAYARIMLNYNLPPGRI